jgi:hypothetical protein
LTQVNIGDESAAANKARRRARRRRRRHSATNDVRPRAPRRAALLTPLNVVGFGAGAA